MFRKIQKETEEGGLFRKIVSSNLLPGTSISAAGNTQIPACLALESRGFTVKRHQSGNGDEEWMAEDGQSRYSSPSPLELLGLVAMRQVRGENWKATDAEIDAHFAKWGADPQTE